jgi:glycosyltransferase involved in cell wall biosynthesis
LKILISDRGIPQSPNWSTGDALAAAFGDLGHEVVRYGRYYSRAPAADPASDTPETKARLGRPLAQVPHGEVDLLIYMGMCDEDQPYIELLTFPAKRRVLWDFDSLLHWDLSVALMQSGAFSHAFLANRRACRRVEGSRWLPYAADVRHFVPGTAEREGAACIGSRFEERADFCRRAGVELVEGLYRGDYVQALQKLKIHVHNHESGGDGLVVMRPFETMAAGALLLAPAGLLDGLFVPGVHYVAYSDAEDCREKVGRFLEDDGARESITASALRLVLEEHTYRCRAQTILEVME